MGKHPMVFDRESEPEKQTDDPEPLTIPIWKTFLKRILSNPQAQYILRLMILMVALWILTFLLSFT